METFSTFHILVAFIVGLALGVEIAKPKFHGGYQPRAKR